MATIKQLQKEIFDFWIDGQGGFDFAMNYMDLEGAIRRHISKFLKNCSKEELIELVAKINQVVQ
jgi:hypothetical protein